MNHSWPSSCLGLRCNVLRQHPLPDCRQLNHAPLRLPIAISDKVRNDLRTKFPSQKTSSDSRRTSSDSRRTSFDSRRTSSDSRRITSNTPGAARDTWETSSDNYRTSSDTLETLSDALRTKRDSSETLCDNCRTTPDSRQTTSDTSETTFASPPICKNANKMRFLRGNGSLRTLFWEFTPPTTHSNAFPIQAEKLHRI